jgi:hypothetical protein
VVQVEVEVEQVQEHLLKVQQVQLILAVVVEVEDLVTILVNLVVQVDQV